MIGVGRRGCPAVIGFSSVRTWAGRAPYGSFQDDRRVGGNDDRAPNRGLMEATEELHTTDLILDRYRLGRRLGAGGVRAGHPPPGQGARRAPGPPGVPPGPPPAPPP